MPENCCGTEVSRLFIYRLLHADWVNYLNMRLPNFANNALFPFIVIPS